MSTATAHAQAYDIAPLQAQILRAAGVVPVWAWEVRRARSRGHPLSAVDLSAARRTAFEVVDEHSIRDMEAAGLVMAPEQWAGELKERGLDWTPRSGMPRLPGME